MPPAADETTAPMASTLVRAGRAGSGRRTAIAHGTLSRSVIPLVDRRAFIGTLAGSLLAAPLAAEAQMTKIPHVGMILVSSSSSFSSRIAGFRQGLHDLGYVEGRDVVLEYRFAEGRPEGLPALASDLVRLNVQVIVTAGTPATLAAKDATSAIPIVMANVGEAVGLGIIASLARPGGNITGSSYLILDLVTKQLEALKEVLPRVTQVAVLWNPTNPVHQPALTALETATQPLGLYVNLTAARDLGEIEAALSTIAREGVGALVVLDDGVFVHHRTRIASLALQSRLPTVSGLREEVEAGGLIAYGPNLTALAGRAAYFVDKILKGVKPADLPVEQPTNFELVINLKTAKALGLTIPPSLLQRADQVIE